MISDQEYQEIVKAEGIGLITVGIERSFARKIFTDVPLSILEQKSGEPLRIKKVISLSTFIGAPLLVLLSYILFIKSFGWWAVLGLPVFLFSWMFYKSTSVRGGATLNSISFIAVVALLNTPLIWETKFIFLLPYILGLWLERFLYCYTTRQLRNLVLRSKKAFVEFQGGVSIKEINTSS